MSGISTPAFADENWRILIDCWAAGVTNSGSTDDIWIEVWEGRSKKAAGPQEIPDDDCDNDLSDGWHQYPWIARLDDSEFKPGDDPTISQNLYFRLLASGDDAIWIDQLGLAQWCGVGGMKNCGEGNKNWGVDGEKGWCFSTDTSDSFGSDRQSGSCSPCWEFWPDGTTKRCSVSYENRDASPAPVSAAQESAHRKYKIKIKTGTRSGAGTDSNIYISIHGAGGKTPEFRANGYLTGNAFESGDLDSFTVSVKDVGDVTGVKVRSDNSYAGSGWDFAWIEIDGKKFTCNCWIDGDRLSKTFP